MKTFKWNRMSGVAMLIFAIFIIIYMIAWNRGLTLLYVLAALSLATLVLSFIAPYFNILGIDASIEHPKEAYQGETIPITITLTSKGLLSKYFLELWWQTTFLEESSQMFFVAKLGKKKILKADVLCEIRGTHQTGPLSIENSFPLGINTFTVLFQDTIGEVIVFPAFVPIYNFAFSADESSILHGDISSLQKGGHDEFISIREYKEGDSPRHIHWPASAKTGDLMVREYQDSLSSSLVIILDLHESYDIGTGKETTLEYAITIASSLSLYALDQGYRVTLFGHGEEKIELLDIVGSENHIQILKSLAYAKGDGDESYDDVIHHVLSSHQKGGTLVLFGNGDQQLYDKLSLYASKFFKPVLFDIIGESFRKEQTDKDFLLEDSHRQSRYTLRKGCDIERMFL